MSDKNKTLINVVVDTTKNAINTVAGTANAVKMVSFLQDCKNEELTPKQVRGITPSLHSYSDKEIETMMTFSDAVLNRDITPALANIDSIQPVTETE